MRTFLKLLATSTLLFGSLCSAQSNNSTSNSTSSNSTNALQEPQAAYNNDIAVLNFALTFEYLASSFYGCYLSPINASYTPCANASVAAFTVTDFANAGYNASVFNAVSLLANEKIAQNRLLNATIVALGGVPVNSCAYNLTGYQNVSVWLNTAQVLEASGAAAFAGAFNGLTNGSLLFAAGGVATVTARHSAFLNEVLGVNPTYASGFEPTLNSTQVVTGLSAFYLNASCLTAGVQPTVRPYGVSLGNSTNTTSYSGTLSSSSNYTYTTAARLNDLKTLQYALFLENLEAALYNQAATTFNASQYTALGYPASTSSYVAMFAANENTHVGALQAVISAYGATPYSNCTYNFTSALSSIPNYLALAAAAEALGVTAYLGASNTITDTNLLQVAATIATIEARHSAILNQLVAFNTSLNYSLAFPVAQDAVNSPLAVLNTVLSLGIVTSCPFVNISDPIAVAALAPVVTSFALTQATAPSNSSSNSSSSSTGGAFSGNSSSSTGSSTGSAANSSSSAGSSSAGSSSSGSIFNSTSSSSGSNANSSSSTGAHSSSSSTGGSNSTTSTPGSNSTSSSTGSTSNSTSSSSSGASSNSTSSSSSGTSVNTTSSSSTGQALFNGSSSTGSSVNSSTGATNSGAGLSGSSSAASGASSSASSSGASPSSSSSNVGSSSSSSASQSSSAASSSNVGSSSQSSTGLSSKGSSSSSPVGFGSSSSSFGSSGTSSISSSSSNQGSSGASSSSTNLGSSGSSSSSSGFTASSSTGQTLPNSASSDKMIALTVALTCASMFMFFL